MSVATTCWVCGAPGRGRPAAEGGFDRVRCAACDALYVNPVRTEAEAQSLYQHELRWSLESPLDKGIGEPGRVYTGRRTAVHGRIAGELQRVLRRPGRLLDVGCGAGAFMQFMSGLGWAATGLEVNPDSVALCRRRGLRVEEGSLVRAQELGGPYDCVTFLNSLGYMADPLEHLRRARGLLAPNGVVVVEDPNAWFHRLSAEVLSALGRREVGLIVAPRPPRRLFVFSRRSYRILFERAGLRDVRIIPSRARPEGAPWAIVARRLIYAGGEGLFGASQGRLLWTPSLLAFGRGPAAPSV